MKFMMLGQAIEKAKEYFAVEDYKLKVLEKYNEARSCKVIEKVWNIGGKLTWVEYPQGEGLNVGGPSGEGNCGN